MKILFLSTSDLFGGAFIAAYRLLKGLQQNGVQVQMLVQYKSSDDNSVVIGLQTKWDLFFNMIRPFLTFLGDIPIRFYKQRKKTTFSPAIMPDNISKKVKNINPDIVHLNWVASGFVKIETLAKINKPIVWTLHDMWAISGGCHYDEECGKYINNCGRCPLLNSNKKEDLSYKILKRKKKAWKNLDLTIVTVSSWLGKCAKKSSLFHKTRVEVIPNGIDLNCFRPIDKNIARNILHLPEDKKLILFGAIGALSDKRKGFPLLKEALKELSSKGNNNVEIVMFGSLKPKSEENLGFKTHYLGRFYDEISLALVYSAANVMIVPSMQEAFGQTASESLACGTPVVAFGATGLLDVVDHQKNGYLAKPYDAADLAYGIKWVLEDDKRREQLCRNAREKVINEFDIVKVAKKYEDLYKDVIKNRRDI